MTTRTEALKLASIGWLLCPMESGSKNPGSMLGKAWQTKCTNDAAIIEQWPDDCNVGVLLGRSSGIIDLEFDSDQGEMLVNSWIEDCGGIVTPTYRSSKSVHRLFAWNDQYELEGAKFGLFGVEFRWGQDAAQSVVPPSLHESGVRYEWLEGMAPWECSAVALPDLIYKQYLSMKATSEKQHAKSCSVPQKYVEGDSFLDRARKQVESEFDWGPLLSGDGWKFCRNRGEAQDWWRPGKSRGSISGTVNYGGSRTLRVFTTSASGLKADSSYDKFAYLCATKFQDDPILAARAYCKDDVPKQSSQPAVSFAGLEKQRPPEKTIRELIDAPDDDEFCASVIPESGLILAIFDFYCRTSQFPSSVMGLATALSLCEMLFGRRITSETDLRTNDYNVVMAPTGSGKEACETAITRILESCCMDGTPLIPPDVQSGNGLIKALHSVPRALWICDEFEDMLEAVIDKRGSNHHLKMVGTHLLKLYGKSAGTYGGAAHADGVRNRIVQPHLCLLGLCTPGVFSKITGEQVNNGLFGRMAFWTVQNRPKSRLAKRPEVTEYLQKHVGKWINWEPSSLNPEYPAPETLRMTPEALERWLEHRQQILDRMDREGEMRAGVWSRVAARSMKLAMVHRAAKMEGDPATTEWLFERIEPADMEWGIRLSNWLARSGCGLLMDDVVDMQGLQARQKIMTALQHGPIAHRDLCRKHKRITSAEFSAAAEILEAAGQLEIEEVPAANGGRAKVVYKVPVTIG